MGRRGVSLVVGAVVVFGGAVGTASAAQASYPGANGLLAVNRNGDIWTMTLNGTNLRQLTHTGNNENPRWSPNGRRIAFASTRTGTSEIFVMSATGTGLTQVTTLQANQTYPTWSPDGTKLAFASDRGERKDSCGDPLRNIFALHSTAPFGTAVQVTHDTGQNDAFWPAWSPSGSSIAFVRNNAVYCNEYGGFSPQVFTVAPAGGAETLVNTAGCCDYWPNWSPGADKIAFASDRGGQYPGASGPVNIYQSTANGSGLAQITHFRGTNDYASSVTWAPSGGTSVVFDAQHGTTTGIYQINANGTGLRTVILGTSTTLYIEPDWQP